MDLKMVVVIIQAPKVRNPLSGTYINPVAGVPLIVHCLLLKDEHTIDAPHSF